MITAIIAALAALLGVVMGAYSQRAQGREARIFGARLAALQEISGAIFEYERATYDRVITRIKDSNPDRGPVRAQAWAANSRTRSAIGVLSLLSDSDDTPNAFEGHRKAIGEYNDLETKEKLTDTHEDLVRVLVKTIQTARVELAPGYGSAFRRYLTRQV